MAALIKNAARQDGEKKLLQNEYIDVPHEMRAQVDTWILWKYTNDRRKMPDDWTHQPGEKYKGANNPALHLSFGAAVAKLSCRPQSKLGLYLGDGVRLTVDGRSGYLWCFDLDGFAGVKDGAVHWEREACTLRELLCGTYAEVSPSGTGLKFFFVANRAPVKYQSFEFGESSFLGVRSDVRKYQHREIEIFSHSRFLTVTANGDGGLAFIDDTRLNEVMTWLGEHGEPRATKAQQEMCPLPFEKPEWLRRLSTHDDETIHNILGKPPKETRDNVALVKSYLGAINADCTRDKWLRVVFAVAAYGWDCGETVAREWSQTAPARFTQDGFDSAWRSFDSMRGNHAALRAIAIAEGWKPARAEPIAVGSANSATEGMAGTVDQSARARFRLLSRDDLRHQPDLEWRIDNVLPTTGIGLIIGQSGTGKSFVAIDLLARVSQAMPWFKHATRPCKTVYVVLEGRAGIKRRIEAWERHTAATVAAGFAVVLDGLKITDMTDVDELARTVLDAGGKGSLIVVDTLAQASPGIDENSGADMGLVIAGLQRLQSLTGGFVMGVHHMGKDMSRGARGHSSLYAACDAVLAVTGGARGHILSTVPGDGGKAKDAEPVSHAFTLERVVLYTLNNGREISSAAVAPQGGVTQVVIPREPRGKNMRIVWDRLGVMLGKAGNARPAEAPFFLPDGVSAVRLEDAIREVEPHMPTEPKRRVQRIHEAVTSLVAGGWLERVDGWLWLKS